MADLVYKPGLILAMTFADLQADHTPDAVGGTPVQKGQFGIVIDRYGPRFMRYMHNLKTSVTLKGGLYSRAALVAIASIDAGSTTTSILKAAGFTANALIGRLLYVKTATVAGAAPENETAIIVANTAGVLTLDAGRPLSVAPPTATAVDVYSLFDFIAAASGDLNHNVFGIGIATNGIAAGNWGVLQVHGLCPDAKTNAGAVLTIAKAIIAGTEQVVVSSTSADNLLVGYAPFTVNSTNSGFAPVFIDVQSPQRLTA